MPIEQCNYPYESASHGIDFTSMPDDDFLYIFEGGSGAVLSASIAPSMLMLNDEERGGSLVAIADPANRAFNLALSTRLKDGSRHPDLFAAKFIGVALHHFARNGFRPDCLEAEWTPGGDNYNTFKDGMQTHRDKRDAVLATWTARIIAQYGFTRVEYHNIDVSLDKVGVLFYKEW